MDALERAHDVARQLGIPHYQFNCEERFTENVLAPAWRDYASARTPNPCVLCNERVKFPALFECADALGAAGVATGHYARLEADPAGGWRLRRAIDAAKDQSYFLGRLRPDWLPRLRFPLGELRKPQVRQLATAHGLAVAHRPESQDICFREHAASGFGVFLAARFHATSRPGVFVDRAGREVGRHGGIHGFTIGQRRGVGVALGRPAWVCRVDAQTGAVELTTDAADLDATALTVADLVWQVSPPTNASLLPLLVQARYRQAPVPANLAPLLPDWSRLRARLCQPIRAAAPGQAAVFYDGDRLVASGWIEAAHCGSQP
jgi:tRNA-specific 2-thiouridylase